MVNLAVVAADSAVDTSQRASSAFFDHGLSLLLHRLATLVQTGARALSMLLGIGLCYGLHLLLTRVAHRRFRTRVIIAVRRWASSEFMVLLIEGKAGSRAIGWPLIASFS